MKRNYEDLPIEVTEGRNIGALKHLKFESVDRV